MSNIVTECRVIIAYAPTKQLGPPIFDKPIERAKLIMKNIKQVFLSSITSLERWTERSIKVEVYLWDPDVTVSRR